MAFKKKLQMQGDVFSGISSVFAVKGVITTANASSPATGVTATLADGDMLEFPVSQDSGFNFDTGAPSINHFKVHGMNADWVNTFTPGDGEVKLEIPCNGTDIMKFCFGQDGTKASFTLPAGLKIGDKSKIEGQTYSSVQKAIYLGLLVLDDTETKVLYIKKAKFMAQVTFDGSNKPLVVTLTGSISAGADADAFGVLEPA